MTGRSRCFGTMVVTLALLAACAPAAAPPAPTAAPKSAPTTAPAAAPAPKSAPTAAPAAAPKSAPTAAPAAAPKSAPTAAPAAKASPTFNQAEWDQIVAAAKQEGVVTLAGPVGEARQKALTEGFTEKYGIDVEYLGMGGPELPPRLQREREGGQYLWDVFIAGTTTLFSGLRPMGAVEPIETALILPEVKDPSNWRGGQLPFFDSNRIGLALSRNAGQYFYVNTDQVDPKEFTSWRHLLDPKWKGKIAVARDPLVAGYGRSMFLYWYNSPELGPEFVRALVGQDLQILRDDRAGAVGLAQGKYPICICSDIDTTPLIKEGLPIQMVDPRQMKEGTHATSAYANVAVANRPPHPNAQKVYVNWVLGKEAGEAFSKVTGYASMRNDVPNDWINPMVVPDPSWPVTNTEDFLVREEEIVGFLRDLLQP